MGTILDQLEGKEPGATGAVACPICAAANGAGAYCRHVRWTFDQGGPVDFARFAVETSAYRHPRGYKSCDIPSAWWRAQEDWILDRVLFRFAVSDGYVFGELAELDLLTLDIWRNFLPEPQRATIARA
jgi:hypothetical protein